MCIYLRKSAKSSSPDIGAVFSVEFMQTISDWNSSFRSIEDLESGLKMSWGGLDKIYNAFYNNWIYLNVQEQNYINLNSILFKGKLLILIYLVWVCAMKNL